VPIGVSQFLRAARPNMVAYTNGSLSNSQVLVQNLGCLDVLTL